MPERKRFFSIDAFPNDMDDIDVDITGETTTSEKRKMRSATQRAASRWWNTEAIDLEIRLYIIFIRTKLDHCLVLSLSQSVSQSLSALCKSCSNWIWNEKLLFFFTRFISTFVQNLTHFVQIFLQ